MASIHPCISLSCRKGISREGELCVLVSALGVALIRSFTSNTQVNCGGADFSFRNFRLLAFFHYWHGITLPIDCVGKKTTRRFANVRIQPLFLQTKVNKEWTYPMTLGEKKKPKRKMVAFSAPAIAHTPTRNSKGRRTVYSPLLLRYHLSLFGGTIGSSFQ